ncbi:MAG: hypothetical protein RL885_24355 [Planctomycetota bacterium]
MSDPRPSPLDSSPDEVPFVILLDEDGSSGIRPRPEPPKAPAEEPLLEPEPPVDLEPEPDAALLEAEAAIDRELDEELLYQESERRRRISPLRICQAVALLTCAGLTVLLGIGFSYYTAAQATRPLHSLHQTLRPSGTLGLPLGVCGTLLIFASLAYPIRKHMALRGRTWLTVRSWMRLHVLLGTMGPLLILFHTGFRVTSALGFAAFGAMLVVVVSGLTGRYLLVNLRAVESGELDLGALRQRLEVYQKKLIDLGLPPELLARDADIEVTEPGLWNGLKRVFVGDRESKEELVRLKEAVKSHGGLGQEAKLILVLAKRLCRERQVLVRTSEIRNLVGAWRFLHRWMSVVLVLGALFHIAVAVRFGDLWLLGGGR